MISSRKVFIYNGVGSSAESVDDLKELFLSSAIFASQPDVVTFSAPFNPAGLSTPTFVAPGGLAGKVGNGLRLQLCETQYILNEDFNYVGICAGAFVGTEDAEVYIAQHEMSFETYTYKPPELFYSTKKMNTSLNMVDDYHAIGPFYPHNSVNFNRKVYMPYCTNLLLTGTNQPEKRLKLLYVSGPGFFAAPNKQQTSNVLATYHERYAYEFSDGKQITKIIDKNFPAIISSAPSEKKGGRFLSGVHVEACVPNSKFLKFFQSETSDSKALPQSDYTALVAEQNETRAIVEDLLRRSLK